MFRNDSSVYELSSMKLQDLKRISKREARKYFEDGGQVLAICVNSYGEEKDRLLLMIDEMSYESDFDKQIDYLFYSYRVGRQLKHSKGRIRFYIYK